MSGPTRPAEPGNHLNPDGTVTETGARQVEPRDNIWVPLLILAIVAAALALWAAIYLGNGLHWILWALAAIFLLAGILAFLRRGGRRLKRGLLVASILFSVITLILWTVSYYGSHNTAKGTPPHPSATTSAQAAPATAPQTSGSATAAPPPSPAVAAYPDPNHREYDETPGTNDAVPGAEHLYEQRSKAADLQLPAGDDDFRPPYSPSELKRLGDWELNYLRQHPNDPKTTDLAQHIGMAGSPDGNAVADYLERNAELRPVGPDGLHVNNYTYDASGRVVYSEDKLLPADTLVWFRKSDNQAIARWSCFNWVVEVR